MQTLKDDEFFGDQSSGEDSYGAMGHQEMQAEHEKRRNFSYHESFDVSKELKLQDGFETAYRDHISDAKDIGLLLGQFVYLHHANNSSSTPSIIQTVKQFLEQEQNLNQTDEKQMNTEKLISVLKHDLKRV